MARILIVDNEDVYRTTLSAIFRREGHETRVASSGDEAIQIGRELHPDALVVDWGLRGSCDGLAVAESLQALDDELRVLMITGHSATDVEKSARTRIFKILEKPFGLDDIASALTAALEERSGVASSVGSASS